MLFGGWAGKSTFSMRIFEGHSNCNEMYHLTFRHGHYKINEK
jgi:hypothetical protein